jgi:hypothetical protein
MVQLEVEMEECASENALNYVQNDAALRELSQ